MTLQTESQFNQGKDDTKSHGRTETELKSSFKVYTDYDDASPKHHIEINFDLNSPENLGISGRDFNDKSSLNSNRKIKM